MTWIPCGASHCRQEQGEIMAQKHCPTVRVFLSHESGRRGLGGARQNIWTQSRTRLGSEPRASPQQADGTAEPLLPLRSKQTTHPLNSEFTEGLWHATSSSKHSERRSEVNNKCQLCLSLKDIPHSPQMSTAPPRSSWFSPASLALSHPSADTQHFLSRPIHFLVSLHHSTANSIKGHSLHHLRIL